MFRHCIPDSSFFPTFLAGACCTWNNASPVSDAALELFCYLIPSNMPVPLLHLHECLFKVSRGGSLIRYSSVLFWVGYLQTIFKPKVSMSEVWVFALVSELTLLSQNWKVAQKIRIFMKYNFYGPIIFNARCYTIIQSI